MEKDFFTLSEKESYQILEKALWPEGAICPRCKEKAHLLSCRLVYQCPKCGRQFSLKSQSIMRKSHLSPKIWLSAMFLVCQDGGINAVKLSQLLHISYKASWLLLQKLRSLMRLTTRHHTKSLRKLVKTFFFLSGIKRKQRKNFSPMQVVEIDADDTPSKLHIHLVDDVSSDWLSDFFGKLFRHTPVEKRTPWLSHINDGLKNLLEDVYHYGCRKHMQRYLDEFCFRFNIEGVSSRLEELLRRLGKRRQLLPWKKLVSEGLILPIHA
ncbi:IS1595 family transposase [Thermospira aquatica]|uniref:IS1595 family transposase n=1 Tax=Thermospira aquatica TaxID=2828656 RepID=A0AAX3BDT8_9SPIR|nr:IS1595 family transposase [Thermospira aquatica]URA10323.1 IS1595 family transposase [Thermospira aquatica]